MNKVIVMRIDYIDEIRGLAILLVVVGHLIQFNGFSVNNPIFEFIYSFHMPLFFAISGYITQRLTTICTLNEYLGFIKKKFISLIIPLLVWSLIVNHFFFVEQWEVVTWQNILDCIASPGLWFLKMLFIILCFYGIFNWLTNVLKIKGIFKIIISLIPIALFTFASVYIKLEGINLIMFSYAFYLGVVISKYSNIEKLCSNDLWVAVIACVFMMLSTQWNFGGDYMDDLYKVIISTCAFILCLNIFRKGQFNIRIKHALQALGINSLAIYIIQFYLCHIDITNSIGNILKVPSIILFIIAIVLAVPICYICIFISKIINANKLLSFFLLGKRINKSKPL